MSARVKHIGIAVRDLASAIELYEQLLGSRASSPRHSESEQMEAATFRLGDVDVELMEPSSSESPVGRFLERRGEGVHHIAYEVDDVSQALQSARSLGLETLDEQPRPGLDGTRVGFVHPRSMHGVLTEFVEKRAG